MDKEVWVALIGSFSTIATALIGAYASVASKRKSPNTKGRAQTKPTYKFEIAIVSVAVVIGAAILVFGLPRTSDLSTQLKSYGTLVERGLQQQKSYILPSVAMIVKLEKIGEQLQSDTRIVYQVHALKNITQNDRDFTEFYHTTSGEDVEYLPGADQEVLTEKADPKNKSWAVLFDLLAGQQRTIITGAHRLYPATLKPARKVHQLFENVGSNEEVFMYPNSYNDVIGELVIMVESSTLNLRLGEKPSRILRNNTRDDTSVAQLFDDHTSSPKRKVVVARFKQIQNQDIAGLKVTW